MRDYFKFALDSTLGVNAQKCSKYALGWYKSLQFFCNNYYYCNLNLQRGNGLDERNRESVSKINSIMKRCHMHSPLIGEGDTLCPNISDMARVLFYSKVIEGNSAFDIEMFYYLIAMCEEEWSDMLDWEASDRPNGNRPQVPRICNKPYINYKLGRGVIRVQGNQVVVTQGKNSFFFKISNPDVIPNWVEVKFKDDSVHITFDYNVKGERDIPVQYKPDNGVYIACDVGINNLVTMCNNVGVRPVAVNGGLLKTYNKRYNLRKNKLDNKASIATRDKKIDAVFTGACRKIVAYAIQCDACEVILGRTSELFRQKNVKGFEGSSDFVAIPFNRFFTKLKHYLASAGIKMTIVEDYLTSSTSFFDGEPATAEYENSERRISRALFVTNDNLVVNVDVNAAYQILVTYKPDAFKTLTKVYPHPIKVNPIEVVVKKQR